MWIETAFFITDRLIAYGRVSDMPRASEKKSAEIRFRINIKVCHDVAHLCCIFAIGKWHVEDSDIITS